MSYGLIAIISVFLLTVLGVARTFIVIRRTNERISFLITYHNKLVEYFEKPSEKKREWLIERMDEAQDKLGAAGIIASYRAPYGAFVANDYQIIVNLIPKIHDKDRIHFEDVRFALDSFVRANGMLKNIEKDYSNDLRNPIKLLIIGIKTLLEVPLWLLREVGIINRSIFRAIEMSRLFKFLVGVLGLIGIIETALALITNKSIVQTVISEILKKV